jgi:hypothetical protein
VTGESGRNKKRITPQMQQSAPMIKNSYFQLGIPPLMCPIPYPRRPPREIPSPLAVYQIPIRIGC